VNEPLNVPVVAAPGAPALGGEARDLAAPETGRDAGAAAMPLVPVARGVTGEDANADWGQALRYAVIAALIGALAGTARWAIRARGLLPNLR
jgi:hypothetical protein